MAKSKKYERYMHHDKKVWVRKDLRGTHRENCLCFFCENFDMEDRENNCEIANVLYAVCCAHGLVTPVFECPKFREMGDD